MPRTGKFASVPKGWCWRPATEPGDKGLKFSGVVPESWRNVYKRKDLLITYACPRGHWKSSGKYRRKVKGKVVVTPGSCNVSMRAIRIIKPKYRIKKSKHKGLYHCKRGK